MTTLLTLPPGWRHWTPQAAQPGPSDTGVLLQARAPHAGPSGVLPTIRLSCDAVTDDLGDWRDGVMVDLSHRLAYFELDDTDDYVLDDHRVAYRRYAWRRGAHDLVVEEWSWLIGGLGLTLTCTVARDDYADHADLFDEVAASLDPRRLGRAA